MPNTNEVSNNADFNEQPADITRIIGLDLANSTIKIWTDELNMKYVNTVQKINDAGLVYSFKTDYQMFVYDKLIYEVGLLSAPSSGSRDENRYTSKDYKIEALIAIASCINELSEPQDNEVIRLVTGLPSSISKNQKVVSQIKEMLVGKHEMKVVTWESVKPITFEIKEVIVVPQPLGTMYDYVYDEEQDALNEKLIEQKAVVIDIGYGTTDVAILENARVHSTYSFDIGTIDYISALQEDVNQNMPEASIYSLVPHELDSRLLESSIIETPFGEFDLTKFIQKHQKAQAEKIYNAFMNLGLEYNKFYKIILTGGGALLYEDYLKELFNDTRLIVKDNAVMSNSKGFWLLGNY